MFFPLFILFSVVRVLVASALSNERNEAKNILVENMNAKNVNLAAMSIESWKGGMFENVVLRDISIESVGDNKTELSNTKIEHTV